ncbi:XRE family transcriptional regulator [Limosilactobacillus reuteri]|uniref:XRE family transcriptional regulator n=1 Tax=Limosilactobacillus reuteri TaxID=1598 RepID=A0A855XDX7_LIMRT|nr:helix-turn-helix transcriptional regulator [Limosilactobacillus reuteri]PWT33878.1 XRE family transcriptional regulator [Limosilactobacillus reuteri]PWT39906.1 XRE family transcriptional regulator [Limosilactobacillus reuteri]PWT45343.1 XRE family transcriptional regulator [Limosilactobacillus reuteri]PWT60064.1 XRE family transcriptional regulator [Limosilactobacillus reuteri]PWT68111.1 XRE family transcriptional regulator [Limosilactobacillus reuteri]
MTTVLAPDAYKKLKSEIDGRGLKTKFVAEKIGIGQNYLSQILNGSRDLSANVALKASQVLGVPIDIFLNKS